MTDTIFSSRKFPAWRGILGDVADKCGQEVALELYEKLAGVRFYVPAKYTDSGPLARLDKTRAQAVIAVYGKEIIYVPSMLEQAGTFDVRMAKKKALFEAIEAQVADGLQTADIAKNLGISQGWLFMLRREFGAEKIASIRQRQKERKLEGPVA